MGSALATEDRRAEGVAEVSRALRRLPEGWVTVHDLAWPGRPGATIDHVVVGPGGVFVIAAESWTGTIEVRDQVLMQDGRSREQTVDLAARAAIAVQGIVPKRCFPMICFADGPLTGVAREVMMCSSATVLLKLTSSPERLSPEDVRRCVDALEAAAGVRVPSARGARRGGERKDARQKSGPRPVLVLVGILELLLAIGLVLSGGMQQAADFVTQGYDVVTGTDDEPVTRPVRHTGDADR